MTTQLSFANAAQTGRPRGCKPSATAKAETVADYVNAALANPPVPPPPTPRKPRTPGRKAGIWDAMTPEERSAHGKHLASLRNPQNMKRTKRRLGTPDGWTHEGVSVAIAAARMEAIALTAKLKARGLIAEADKLGERMTIEALTRLRTPGSSVRRIQAAKRLLRHYHPELAGLI